MRNVICKDVFIALKQSKDLAKMNFIPLFILFSLYLCGCDNSSSVNNDNYLSKKQEEAINYNLIVHNMLDYGNAISNDINDVLNDGVGNCGDYSFLLSYTKNDKVLIIGNSVKDMIVIMGFLVADEINCFKL